MVLVWFSFPFSGSWFIIGCSWKSLPGSSSSGLFSLLLSLVSSEVLTLSSSDSSLLCVILEIFFRIIKAQQTSNKKKKLSFITLKNWLAYWGYKTPFLSQHQMDLEKEEIHLDGLTWFIFENITGRQGIWNLVQLYEKLNSWLIWLQEVRSQQLTIHCYCLIKLFYIIFHEIKEKKGDYLEGGWWLGILPYLFLLLLFLWR